MKDSDTLPVDHAGNSEAGAGPALPAWLLGAVALPAAATGVAYVASQGERSRTLWGLGTGLGLSMLWVGWVAWRDFRRVRLARQLQDMIEDAWTAHAKGEAQRAEQLLKECVRLAGEKLGRWDLVTLACLHTLGNLYRLRQDAVGAKQCYDQAQPIYDRILPRTHPARAAFHGHRSDTLAALEQPDEAMREARLAVELFRECPQAELALAEACGRVGALAFAAGDYEQALEPYNEALQLVRLKLTVRDPRVLGAMGQLCKVYIKLRRHQESEQYLLELLEQHRSEPEEQCEGYLEALLDLAWLRLDQERGEAAEPLLLEALQLLQTRIGPRERPLQRVLDAYRKIAHSSPAGSQATHGLVNLVLVFCGERERLRQTLEKFPLWMNARDATGWGPLHWACFVGREDILRWLIGKGADVNLPQDRVSPLHIAAAWGKRECILELLEAGCDPNARDPRGWTPLFWCCQSGRVKQLELFLKRGADVNLRDDLGRTPLHIAAEHGHLGVVAALVGSGASLAARDFAAGSNPLHVAAERGQLAVCECLVFNQGDLSSKNEKGRTPRDLARDSRHRLVERVLIRLAREGLGRSRRRGGGPVQLDVGQA